MVIKANFSASNIEARIGQIEQKLQSQNFRVPGGRSAHTITPDKKLVGGTADFQTTMQALVKNQLQAGKMNIFIPEQNSQTMHLGISKNNLNMGMLTMLKNIASQAGQGSSYNFANGLWAQLPQVAKMQEVKHFQSAELPVNGRISSGFDHDRMHPMHAHKQEHLGVDIAADRGSPIKSPWAGQVMHVGEVNGFGPNTIVVAHPGTMQPDGKVLYSVFGHNESASVRPGQQIDRGQTIAAVGSEGNSTGPHLHWETRWAPAGLKGTEIFSSQLAAATDPLNFA